MDVSKLVDFLAAYPPWVRVLFSIWVTISAALLLCFIFFRDQKVATATGSLEVQQSPSLTPPRLAGRLQRRFSIIDVATGNGLDDTVAMAYDSNVTRLHRESVREKLDGWFVEVCGKLCDVERLDYFGGTHPFHAHLALKYSIGYYGASIFLKFPLRAEDWLRSLRPGDELVFRGYLRPGAHTLSLDDARPVLA